MTISELIECLLKLKETHGDLYTRIDSISHSWPPDPVIRERGGQPVVVLNG